VGPNKDRATQEKHGISFNEAATAFDDELQMTISDPDHSVGEHRYLTLGMTSRGRLVVWSSSRTPRMRMTTFGSSTRDSRRPGSAESMKEGTDVAGSDEMRDEYDFRGAVRGKYFERYRQGTSLVLLEPDLAKVFRDAESVNLALRQFLAEHGEPPQPSK
jgi:hypothetical protein